MGKIAFKMKLKPGCQTEYKNRHEQIWPELALQLKNNGVSDYSIFLDEETDVLFAVQQQRERSSQDLGDTDIVKRWWAHMADIMETNPDNSPVSISLDRVFHLD